MKHKVIVWLYLVVLSIGTIVNLYAPQIKASGKEEIIIPGEAIRLRILANSDRAKDQELKRKVRDEVNVKITEWVEDLTSLEEARGVIKGHLPEIQAVVRKVLDENGSSQAAKTEFGTVKFPTKLYGQFLYPAGEYEAILITLGEGKGANWWCVLYPPLCFLDFSSGTAVRSPGFEDGNGKAPSRTEPAEKHADEKHALSPVEKTAPGEPAETVSPLTSSGLVEGNGAKKLGKPAGGLGEEGAKDYESKQDSLNQSPKVYTPEDEQPVKVKFFVVELWKKIID
ncbi:stage II sporulation protein R [Bacillus sp. FJAT-27445]|uniref:stage II sporulation protein R n=1 Tax=Bacillus sp. FJAT-27445 TaxID=1679166 RepID=UPI0007436266|nr:stage II sporulation protein R [Bacillus sp. FJAT-27445]